MQKLDALRQTCENCQACALGSTRTSLVFGDGNPDAEIMFIGEGPGRQEDLTGIPFVGAAGQFLSQILEIIDLDRTRYYIANIVKCRPPGNRDPSPAEQDCCIGYLMEQIRLVDPKIIVCLGRIAACRLIRPDFRITREHGQWFRPEDPPEDRPDNPLEGRWLTAIFHPSALLRDLSKRPETFDDLKSIQARILEVCPEVYRT